MGSRKRGRNVTVSRSESHLKNFGIEKKNVREHGLPTLRGKKKGALNYIWRD